jgi:hypothetical protein
MAELRDIDLALASYPEAEWVALAGPVLLEPLRGRVGVDEDEAWGAVRRASYLAAAGGDPAEGEGPDGAAIREMAGELHTRERALALSDAARAELGRATAQRLPRVEQVLRTLVAPPADDVGLPWRVFCAGLYAALLAEDEDG